MPLTLQEALAEMEAIRAQPTLNPRIGPAPDSPLEDALAEMEAVRTPAPEEIIGPRRKPDGPTQAQLANEVPGSPA